MQEWSASELHGYGDILSGHSKASISLTWMGCCGPITTNGASKERTDGLHWTCVCLLCGADFGRMRIGGQNTLATVLGVLSAGSTYQHYSASCIFSNVLALSGTAFYNAQAKILRLVDQVYDEHIQRQRECLREDPKRWIKVRKDHIYFIWYADKLYELMDTEIGLKVRSMLYILISWCV